ncbi:Protein phosphatase 2C 1 [Borealophlyctis nickersoniae]|nr:Protein phosphatase 2C 1 [Borealophlyctis nickersoniae]
MTPPAQLSPSVSGIDGVKTSLHVPDPFAAQFHDDSPPPTPRTITCSPCSVPIASPPPPSTTSLDDLDDGGSVATWSTNTVVLGVDKDTDDEDEDSAAEGVSNPKHKSRQKQSGLAKGNSTEDEDSDAGGSRAGTEEVEDVEDLSGFKVGVAEERNKKYRRTMEDAHSYFHNYIGAGSGWFAIFDGHAGKSAAEWCGGHLHETFRDLLQAQPDTPIPELLNKSFLQTDKQLSEKQGLFSGCTAVVAVLRTEEREELGAEGVKTGVKKSKRVLYTANVGDARAVLCRKGQAVRLSYDHKGSDSLEARRIQDAGGFVMNNRVNGVLAVTRSLGDITMKEWVIGSPFTTESVVEDDDPFLILACDGLWDVCSDQNAVDLIRDVQDPQQAAEDLLEHALENFSTDNLSVLVIRFKQNYLESRREENSVR